MDNKYLKKKKEYLNKFGSKSLDNVIIPDILHDGIDGMEEFYQELSEAIKSGIPIASMDPKEFKSIIR